MANRFEKYTLEPEQTSVPQQTQSPNRFAKYSIDPTVTEELLFNLYSKDIDYCNENFQFEWNVKGSRK